MNHDKSFASSEGITGASIVKFDTLRKEGPADCRARQGRLRCCLDSIHREMGTSHLHRDEDGTISYFRDKA